MACAKRTAGTRFEEQMSSDTFEDVHRPLLEGAQGSSISPCSGIRRLAFSSFIQRTSERVSAAALRKATKQKRSVRYLESARPDE